MTQQPKARAFPRRGRGRALLATLTKPLRVLALRVTIPNATARRPRAGWRPKLKHGLESAPTSWPRLRPSRQSRRKRERPEGALSVAPPRRGAALAYGPIQERRARRGRARMSVKTRCFLHSGAGLLGFCERSPAPKRKKSWRGQGRRARFASTTLPREAQRNTIDGHRGHTIGTEPGTGRVGWSKHF